MPMALASAEQELSHRIGPYRVEGELGRGGMGVVYRAEHVATGEKVALKTVTGVDPTRLAYLRREIDALRRAQHPGIVRIVDSGVEGGVPYYAMELLEGATLRNVNETLWTSVQQSSVRLKVPTQAASEPTLVADMDEAVPQDGEAVRTSGTKPPAAAGDLGRMLDMVRMLCEPLALLHARGLVHRDLKPENVFVRSDGTPVLVDLGVASRFGGARGREALEVAGVVIGSVAYMSPEQTRGELVDARADLYALGCILYECITGRPPLAATGGGAMLYTQQFVVPPSPSELVDGVPPELDALVIALLKKRPADRIGYASDVASALEALGAKPVEQAVPAPAYLYRPKLAGRADPLRTLERAFVEGAGGHGGCFYVGGESGAGKTRIVMEAATLATMKHRLRVLTGECLAVGVGEHDGGGAIHAAPLHPFRRILDAVADRCREAGAEEADRVLGPRGKILAPYEPALASLPGQDAYPEPLPMPAQAARDRVAHALLETLLAFAAASPVLIVLDDLQWADELTLAFLASLDQARLATEPLLVVGTYREEERGPALDRLLATEGARQLVLGPLEQKDVAAMTADMLATPYVPDGITRRVADLSRGNPFFVSEYLRSVVDDGLLERTAKGRWALDDRVESRLPEVTGIFDLLGRRLRALQPRTREALQAAAVLGRDVDLATLGAAIGASDAAIAEAVEELVTRAIVEPGSDGVFRFAHDKLREFAYASIPPARLRGLHRCSADAIRDRWKDTPDLALHYAVLGHHYALAGADADAVDWLERAAEQSLEAGSYGEAIHHYRRAMDRGDAAGASAARRARWSRRVGEATFALGDLPESERHLAAGLERLGHPVPRSGGERARAFARGLVGQAARMLGLRKKEDVAPDRHEELQESAQTAADLAFHYYFVNDIGGQLVMSLLSANEAESATREVPVPGPYIWLGYTSGLMRLHGLAKRYFDKARENADKTRNRADYCFSLSLEGVYHVGYPNWDEARERTSRADALLADYDDPQRFELNEVVRAQIDFYTGRTATSDEEFARLFRSAQKRQNAQHTGWAEYGIGRSHVCAGRYEEGIRLLDAGLAHLAATLDRATEMMCMAWKAAALAWSGRPAEAWSQASACLARLRAVAPAVVFTLDAYSVTADVILDFLERREVPEGTTEKELHSAAAAAVRETMKFAMVFPFGAAASLRARGRLAAARGDVRKAERLFQKSLVEAERTGMPGEAATTLLAWARATAGQPAARAHAKRALALATELDWGARAEQARIHAG